MHFVDISYDIRAWWRYVLHLVPFYFISSLLAIYYTVCSVVVFLYLAPGHSPYSLYSHYLVCLLLGDYVMCGYCSVVDCNTHSAFIYKIRKDRMRVKREENHLKKKGGRGIFTITDMDEIFPLLLFLSLSLNYGIDG